MQLWKKMKKNRKGFTLVEIIVVLVILAILAAFTIPAMLGFVKEAQSKAYVAEAREMYVAAQAQATERISAGVDKDAVATAIMAYKKGTAPSAETDPITYAFYNVINGDCSTDNGQQPITGVTIADNGQVTGMTYTIKKGTTTYKMVYDNINKTWNTTVS